MKSRKVLIFIWDLGIGGIQKRIKDILLSQNNNKKIKFYVLVKNKKDEGFYNKVKHLSNVKIYFSKESKFFSKIKMLFWVLKKINSIKPDVVLTFLDSFSVYMSVLKNLFNYKYKLILNEGILTSRYIKHFRKKTAFFWNLMVKIYYPKANLIIVPSIACKNDLIKNYFINKRLIKVIPNWTLFKVNEREIIKKEFDLIYVGRIEKEKAVDDLIFVVKKLSKHYPKIRLAILGIGSEENKIKDLVKKFNLDKNVYFFGFVNNVSKYLQKSKIFVIPSKNEGIPNVVLEAYECGLPIVSNNFLGANEVVVNKKTGFIVKNRSELYEKVLYLMKNNKIRKDMGREGKIFKDKKFGKKNQDEFIGELLKS